MEQTKWMAIANPVSGFGSVRKKWAAIKAELEAQHVDFDFRSLHMTAKGGHWHRMPIPQGISQDNMRRWRRAPA
jgi:diacylglycerol kinase family enzyme